MWYDLKVSVATVNCEGQKCLRLSRLEAKTLQESDIRCPICGFRIQGVYSDASGYLSVKCQKCKNISSVNLEYFRYIYQNR